MPTVLRASLLYFCAVFAAGFALGSIRVLFLVDVLGERYAELAEIPFMILVCGAIARYLVAKHRTQLSSAGAISIGIIGLVLLLTVELSFVLSLRGLSISQYFASRDLVSGIAYIVGLGWYALAPITFYIAGSRSHA